ncbi:hypothetical protein GGE68_002035 [Rhizobium leguminosarum]|nr:hypothetical protein [Rhizobium leguminosarum]
MISKARLRPLAASTVMAATIVACLVEPAFAQAAGIETVLQNIVDMLTGNIARLLAVIAVIIICIAWIPRRRGALGCDSDHPPIEGVRVHGSDKKKTNGKRDSSFHDNSPSFIEFDRMANAPMRGIGQRLRWPDGQERLRPALSRTTSGVRWFA